MLLKFAPVKCVLVLPALIRVHNQTLYRRKSFKRFIQHILDLFHVRTGREIVGNNLIGIHVKNRRNVAFTPRQIELRYICCSLLKRLLGTEIPIDNVISDLAHIAFVGMVLLFWTFAKQSKLIHDSLDTLVIYQKATVQKLPMYPSYAISLPVLVENGNNFRR